MSAKFSDYGPTLAELLVDRSPENLTLQLSEVDSAIARLSERSRDLRERINTTNPFLSLPAEIISEISMIACQPVYDGGDPDNFAASTQFTAPLTLGKICRTWRQIAWACPRLWNVIFLELRREHEIYKAQLEVLQAWLLRSGDLLLSMHLDEWGDEPGKWFERPPTEVFDLLASYSHRWLHLRTFLIGSCWEDLQDFPLPFLTSLAIGPPAHDAEYERTWQISEAPCLRNVYIWADIQEQVKLPTHQLTRITWWSLEWPSCLSLLKGMPSVVHCTLPDVRTYDSDYQPVISLPHLSTFTVESSWLYEDPLRRILSCITAPSLYRMQLAWSELSGLEPWATIRAFLSRSSCSLREFTLKTEQFSRKEKMLIALLADMESLEKLELICREEGILDPLLNHLNPSRPQGFPQYLPAAQILLPNLRCFRYEGPIRFQIKTLVEMIDMRYRMAYDREKDSKLGCEENHICVARPEAFDIDIFGVNCHQHTSLLDFAGTLRSLTEEHSSVTFSFFDEDGIDIPLF